LIEQQLNGFSDGTVAILGGPGLLLRIRKLKVYPFAPSLPSSWSSLTDILGQSAKVGQLVSYKSNRKFGGFRNAIYSTLIQMFEWARIFWPGL
jgi:hypothetical protein